MKHFPFFFKFYIVKIYMQISNVRWESILKFVRDIIMHTCVIIIFLFNHVELKEKIKLQYISTNIFLEEKKFYLSYLKHDVLLSLNFQPVMCYL